MKVRSLHILQAEGGILEPKYNNLNELIADYIKKGDKNGLTYALKIPVSPERGEEFDSGKIRLLTLHMNNFVSILTVQTCIDLQTV